MTTDRYRIEKYWDDNERTREGRNGRLYTSRARWQWVVYVNDEADSAHDTRREAAARAAVLAERARAAGRAVSGPGAVWRAPTDRDAARAAALARPAVYTTPPDACEFTHPQPHEWYCTTHDRLCVGGTHEPVSCHPPPAGDRAALATLATAHAEARYCTACGRHVSTCDDWTLWPWGDGAALCLQCNDKRHETEEYR